MEADVPYLVATAAVIVVAAGLFEVLVPRDRMPRARRLILSAIVIFAALLALNFLWQMLPSPPTSEG